MDWIQQIPNWLPVFLVAFGLQAWALRVIYSMRGEMRENKIGDDARYRALKLEVDGKVNHEQARTVVHQYHVDEKRMRADILQEMKEAKEATKHD